MIVFVNPGTFQVEAVFSHSTDSTVWTDQGFVEYPVADTKALRKITRNHKATIKDGVVTSARKSVNPVQPAVDLDEANRGLALDRLKSRSLVDENLADLMTVLELD